MTEEMKDCNNCGNRCMDMDMDPYCAAVNQPWGQVLYRGKPTECGEKSLLWIEDKRRAYSDAFTGAVRIDSALGGQEIAALCEKEPSVEMCRKLAREIWGPKAQVEMGQNPDGTWDGEVSFPRNLQYPVTVDDKASQAEALQALYTAMETMKASDLRAECDAQLAEDIEFESAQRMADINER